MKHGKPHRIRAICTGAFLLASLSLYSADTNGYLLVINPGSSSSESLMKGWEPPITRSEIAAWGPGKGFVVEDDREPVVDHMAAYVSSRGSVVSIGGLSRGVCYRVWIDFVRIRYGKDGPPSTLKIFAAAPGFEKRSVETFLQGDCAEGYRHFDLPLDMTSMGSVELIFVEYAPRPGNWGVWDIIVSSGPDLPARGSMRGNDTINLEIMDRIVQ